MRSNHRSLVRPIVVSACCGVVFVAAASPLTHAQGEIRRLTSISETSFGTQVCSTGDLNQDGYADMAVGNTTATRIYSGLDGSILRQVPKGVLADLGDVDLDGFSDLLIAPTTTGLISVYSGATGLPIWQFSGSAARAARLGDYDGDGRNDAIIATSSGITIRSGSTGLVLNTYVIASNALAAGGRDVDADGKPDFIVNRGLPNPDVAEVISSATGAVLWSVAATTNGSMTVALLGDVDSDSRPDFAIGEPGYLSSLGRVRAFSGATGVELWQTTGNSNSGRFGRYLIDIPDVNVDQRTDLLVAADSDAGTGSNVSSVTCLSGRTGATNFKTFSTDEADEYGQSMAAVGDVNGDQKLDFVIGEPLGSWQQFNTGIAYVYSTHCWGQYADLPGCAAAGIMKPTLAVNGCISPLCTALITVTGAKGGVPGALLIRGIGGITYTGACVPTIDPLTTILIPFVTFGPPISGAGSFAIPLTMPTGISPSQQFNLRVVTVEPAQPSGMVLSNGISLYS